MPDQRQQRRGPGPTLAFGLALASLMLASCAGSGPPAWQAAGLPQWQPEATTPAPSLVTELRVALETASEHCAGDNARLLERLAVPFLNGLRFTYDRDQARTRHYYRGAYGDRWEAVLADDLKQLRSYYATHPTPDRFCQFASATVQYRYPVAGQQLARLIGRMRWDNAAPAYRPPIQISGR